MDQRAFTLIELLIVLAIISILTAVTTSVITRFRDKQTVRLGIYKIFEIKKAIERISVECNAYPMRDFDAGWNSLSYIIQRTAGNPMTKWPTSGDCDALSLEEVIATSMMDAACDSADIDCRRAVINGPGSHFNSVFVEDTGGLTSDCNETVGWNYALITPAAANIFDRPVPVVCGNVLYKGRSVTVVVNGGGIVNGIEVPDGSGTIGPDGMGLMNACPCGAWCFDNYSNSNGCCNTCADDTGTVHDGIGFKY